MPTSPHSSSEPSTLDRRRLEYERKQAKAAVRLLCGAVPSESAIDDMLNPSEIMALRHDLVAITARLREIKSKYRNSEKHVPTDDEIKKMFDWF